MGSADQIHVVLVEEFGNDFRTKGERDTPVILTPAHRVLVRIGPEEVAQEALVRNVCRSHDPPNLLHGLEVRAQAAVAAEDLLVHDSRYGQAVEAVRKRLPQLNVVPAFRPTKNKTIR